MASRVDAIVAGMCGLVVDTLNLRVPPSAIDTEKPIADLEIEYDGMSYFFDSVDVVDIVASLEDLLKDDLLEDEAFQALFSDGTIRSVATFLDQRYRDDRVQKLCAVANKPRATAPRKAGLGRTAGR